MCMHLSLSMLYTAQHRLISYFLVRNACSEKQINGVDSYRRYSSTNCKNRLACKVCASVYACLCCVVVLKAEGQALGCSQLGNCHYSLHCFLHYTTLGLSSLVTELSHQPVKKGRRKGRETREGSKVEGREERGGEGGEERGGERRREVGIVIHLCCQYWSHIPAIRRHLQIDVSTFRRISSSVAGVKLHSTFPLGIRSSPSVTL